MSVEVELARLLEVAAELGTVPMLLTTDADGRARASATAVAVRETTAWARVGRKSLANAVERNRVSLLWPAPPGGRMALLVDGEVTAVHADGATSGAEHADPQGGVVVIAVSRGILHVVTRPEAPDPAAYPDLLADQVTEQ